MAQRGRRTSQIPGMVSGGPKDGGSGRSSGGSGEGRGGSGRGGAGAGGAGGTSGTGRGPAGKSASGRSASGKAGSAKAKAGARQSIAAVRRSKGDRTQLIIGGIAVVVIIAIIVVGLVLYKKNTAVQGGGYGVSTQSTATVNDKGVITVSHGNPSLELDIYEDALCPVCRDFEKQFGQQIAKAIDEGKLTVNYHMVDFLNNRSASGDYSTRAFAALIAVAKDDGSKPGVFMQFHSALFDEKNQPEEHGTTDLSNAQLADLAGTVKASSKAQKAISDGTQVSEASTAAAANLNKLDALAKAAGIGAGTPTVVHDGKPVETNDAAWLTNLLPGG